MLASGLCSLQELLWALALPHSVRVEAAAEVGHWPDLHREILTLLSQGEGNPGVIHSSNSTGDRDWFFEDVWKHLIFQLNYYQPSAVLT